MPKTKTENGNIFFFHFRKPRGGGMMVVRTLHYKLAYTVSTVCPQRLFQFNLYMFTMLQ